jgi:hypothetical protein
MRLYIPETHRHAADERCTCGHASAAHDDRWTVSGGLMLNVPGHGACDVPGCPCRRFRWAAWVFARTPRHAPAGSRGRIPVVAHSNRRRRHAGREVASHG